jgi:hypothetical protein
MAADFVLDFFFLGGDANHDGRVDVRDLLALAINWQGTGKIFSQGDFNYDGKVDVADLTILARNWQKKSDGTVLLGAAMPTFLGVPTTSTGTDTTTTSTVTSPVVVTRPVTRTPKQVPVPAAETVVAIPLAVQTEAVPPSAVSNDTTAAAPAVVAVKPAVIVDAGEAVSVGVPTLAPEDLTVMTSSAGTSPGEVIVASSARPTVATAPTPASITPAVTARPTVRTPVRELIVAAQTAAPVTASSHTRLPSHNSMRVSPAVAAAGPAMSTVTPTPTQSPFSTGPAITSRRLIDLIDHDEVPALIDV